MSISIKAVFGILIICISTINCGCSRLKCCVIKYQNSDDRISYFIIGAGVVSIPKSRQSGILATKVDAVGVLISDQPGLGLGIGYSKGSAISIPSDIKNAIVDVSACKGSEGMKISIYSSDDHK